jgi:HSP20 family protein
VTTLVRWAPFRELDEIERRMQCLLDDVGLAPAFLPAADVYETPDEFVVELELPGYDHKELGIEVSNHTLRLTGERKEQKDETDKAFRLRERLERRFERRFELPPEADVEHVKAVFTKGVLEVRAPKLKAPEAKKVEISTKA